MAAEASLTTWEQSFDEFDRKNRTVTVHTHLAEALDVGYQVYVTDAVRTSPDELARAVLALVDRPLGDTARLETVRFLCALASTTLDVYTGRQYGGADQAVEVARRATPRRFGACIDLLMDFGLAGRVPAGTDLIDTCKGAVAFLEARVEDIARALLVRLHETRHRAR